MTENTNPDPELRALGRAVEQVRRRRGLSLDVLSAAARIARDRLDALERGRFDPTFEQLVAICAALATEPSALVALAERLLDAAPSEGVNPPASEA